MRISDWSSDVCSSDLAHNIQGIVRNSMTAGDVERIVLAPDEHIVAEIEFLRPAMGRDFVRHDDTNALPELPILFKRINVPHLHSRHREGEWHGQIARSEERRVGKECVSTFSSRWSP